jgi:aminopeptidase N
VPYEKGFNLLFALEKHVGGDKFEEFARQYVER